MKSIVLITVSLVVFLPSRAAFNNQSSDTITSQSTEIASQAQLLWKKVPNSEVAEPKVIGALQYAFRKNYEKDLEIDPQKPFLVSTYRCIRGKPAFPRVILLTPIDPYDTQEISIDYESSYQIALEFVKKGKLDSSIMSFGNIRLKKRESLNEVLKEKKVPYKSIVEHINFINFSEDSLLSVTEDQIMVSYGVCKPKV